MKILTQILETLKQILHALKTHPKTADTSPVPASPKTDRRNVTISVEQRRIYFSPDGSDKQTGLTPLEPKKSIQGYINNEYKTGDTLCLRDGVYRENIYIDVNKGGTLEQPLIIVSESYNPKNCIIRNERKDKSTVFISSANQINILGVQIHGEHGLQKKDHSPVKLVAKGGNFNLMPKDILFKDCTIRGTGTDIIGAKFTSYLTIESCNIYGEAYQEIIDTYGSSYFRLQHCNIEGKAGYSVLTMKGGSRNMLVLDNRINCVVESKNIQGKMQKGPALLIGGHSPQAFLAKGYPYSVSENGTCKNVYILDNTIKGEVGEVVRVMGAKSVFIDDKNIFSPSHKMQHCISVQNKTHAGVKIPLAVADNIIISDQIEHNRATLLKSGKLHSSVKMV